MFVRVLRVLWLSTFLDVMVCLPLPMADGGVYDGWARSLDLTINTTGKTATGLTTNIQAHWGTSNATSESHAAAVLSNGYADVWHLNETANPHSDVADAINNTGAASGASPKARRA